MKKHQTYLLITCVMILWGLNVPTIKILVDYFPPLTITSLRILTAGLVVFAILAFMRKVRKPSLREWKFIFIGGLSNIVVHHFFLSIGLTATSATNGGLILGTGPLLTATLSSIILRNKPTFIKVLGFLFGIAGVSFIVLSGEGGLSGLSGGDLFIFISIVSQALSFVLISRMTKTLDPRLLTGYMLVFGGIILFIISLWKEPAGLAGVAHAPIWIWAIFLASAVVATAFGNMVYNLTISRIGPAETSIFLNLSTFFTLVGSAVFLGEVITVYHLLGLVLIVSGVLFGSGALEELIHRRKYKAHRQGQSQNF
ncbi:DMT family transporter [Bacillus sp. FJAT-29790]|uniref:DMT family transporter n=1 Tax=Bacillus sp. FJAT-29790 TaxID=1895002 RepID=UPI001C24E793|nr:DMT family transporter [Bacillus sp. FJAT-29790]MBU8880378.1 DMT family transporter [Bacillus sp. FJAT-29790]